METLRFFIFLSFALVGCASEKPTKTFPIAGRPRPFNHYQRFAHERGFHFEGDIILDPYTSTSSPWENGVIPLVYHHTLRSFERQAILEAIKDITAKTCIRFKHRRDQKDYLLITNFRQGGCFSSVGKVARGGMQQLNLGPGCLHKTTVIHELVHAIGLWHEQSRMDRDDYIMIRWNNIQKRYWRHFQKKMDTSTTEESESVTYPEMGAPDEEPTPETGGTTENWSAGTIEPEPLVNGTGIWYTSPERATGGYDYHSVMHFSSRAFSWDRSNPSITTRKRFPLRFLGTGDNFGGLTAEDAFKINTMYNCTEF